MSSKIGDNFKTKNSWQIIPPHCTGGTEHRPLRAGGRKHLLAARVLLDYCSPPNGCTLRPKERTALTSSNPGEPKRENPPQKRKVNKITLVVRTVEVSMAVTGWGGGGVAWVRRRRAGPTRPSPPPAPAGICGNAGSLAPATRAPGCHCGLHHAEFSENVSAFAFINFSQNARNLVYMKHMHFLKLSYSQNEG